MGQEVRKQDTLTEEVMMVEVGTLDIGTKVVYAETYLNMNTGKLEVEELHLTVDGKSEEQGRFDGPHTILRNGPRMRLVPSDTLVELEA